MAPLIDPSPESDGLILYIPWALCGCAAGKVYHSMYANGFLGHDNGVARPYSSFSGNVKMTLIRPTLVPSLFQIIK